MPDYLDHEGPEVLLQGPEREPRPARAGWSSRPWSRRAALLAAVALVAGGAYVQHVVSQLRLPALTAHVNGDSKTAWTAAASGRPAAPVRLELDATFDAVRTTGTVTLLGMTGPGIADGNGERLPLSTSHPTSVTVSAQLDCASVPLPVSARAYAVRLSRSQGSRRVVGAVAAGSLAARWASAVDAACGSWLARQSLTVLAAAGTPDPLKPSADITLMVVNAGDRAADLGLSTGYGSLTVTAPAGASLVVPAKASVGVRLHVDVGTCDEIPPPSGEDVAEAAPTTADYLGLVSLVGGRPVDVQQQPVPDGLAPTGIVMSRDAADAVAGVLQTACGGLNQFVTLVDPAGFSYVARTGSLVVRIQIDGTPGRVATLDLVSDSAPAGDETAFTPRWTRISGLTPNSDGQVTVTLPYRAPERQSACPSYGAYLPGFTVVARVPVPAGVRVLRYDQFIDLTSTLQVMEQLCPS
jgi:hypothetical protein